MNNDVFTGSLAMVDQFGAELWSCQWGQDDGTCLQTIVSGEIVMVLASRTHDVTAFKAEVEHLVLTSNMLVGWLFDRDLKVCR